MCRVVRDRHVNMAYNLTLISSASQSAIVILIIILLQVGATLCCANLNTVNVYGSQPNCITMSWEIRSDSNCRPNDQHYKVNVNQCDGNMHTLLTPAMDNNNGFRELTIDSNYCGSKCIIQFQDSSVCILLNPSSEYGQNLLRYQCDAECVPVANDTFCERNVIEYHSNGTRTDVCSPDISAQGNCITDLRDCISKKGAFNDVLIITKYCIYSVTNIPYDHETQCSSKESWLDGCNTLLVPLSHTLTYSDPSSSYCGVNQPVCSDDLLTPLSIDDQSSNSSENKIKTTLGSTTGLQTLQTTAVSGSQSRVIANINVNILTVLFASVIMNRYLNLSLVMLILITLTGSIQAIKFGESDVFVREGQPPRSIAIQRRDVSHPLEIRVYSTTIKEYKQHYGQIGCNLTLDEIGIQETQVDPAEAIDLKQHEYSVTFDINVREVSIDLEAYDDQVSEKEEFFILYFNYTELLTDQCALAVSILDNDWLMFNFSSSQAILKENDEKLLYFNLSIIKIGQNEPNVTVIIAVSEPLTDVKGVDFDLLETHYVFDDETNEQRVLVVAYDDDILEAEEYFTLYFPKLTTSKDVLLITETSPNSVRVTIQDDEVAVVGFITEGDVMLQEGGGSAGICAGFDNDMRNTKLNNEVFFIFTITDLSPINPGTGHDLILEPSATVYIDKYGHEDCLDVSSTYDTNLNESLHILSLQIRHTSVTVSSVIFSQRYLNVYITDYHGLVFTLEPSNVTTGAGMDVHFHCDYVGTHASPIWKITHPEGTSRMVSTARLPHNHFSTDTGLVIRGVDETQNMTSYACLFRIYDRDQIVIITSRVGTLIVLETITFDLQLSDINNIQLTNASRMLELFQGDSIPSITIRKLGYSEDTFIVIVRIKSFDTDHCSAAFKPQISWYVFGRHTYEHTLPMLGDELQQPTNYLVEIISPVSSIEKSDTHVVISEPILIYFFDKDITVGFTDEKLTLHEGVKEEICLTAYDHKIHPSVYLNFTLQPQDSTAGCIIFERNSVTLNTTNTTGCAPIFMRDYEACDGKRNITVIATFDGREENNVTFRQSFIIIILVESTADVNFETPLIITSFIIIAFLVLLVIMFGIVIIRIKYREKKKISSKDLEDNNVEPEHTVDPNEGTNVGTTEVTNVVTTEDTNVVTSVDSGYNTMQSSKSTRST